MTVHIYFAGGPFDGTISSWDEPEDVLERVFDEGPGWREIARYRKTRVDEGPAGMRGKQGVWVYAGARIEEKETE